MTATHSLLPLSCYYTEDSAVTELLLKAAAVVASQTAAHHCVNHGNYLPLITLMVALISKTKRVHVTKLMSGQQDLSWEGKKEY
jgi:hypothetical protein